MNSVTHASLKQRSYRKGDISHLGTWRRTVDEKMKMSGSSKTVLAGVDLLASYTPVGVKTT